MIYLRNRRRDIEHGQETKPKNKEDLENKKQKEQKFNPRKQKRNRENDRY